MVLKGFLLLSDVCCYYMVIILYPSFFQLSSVGTTCFRVGSAANANR